MKRLLAGSRKLHLGSGDRRVPGWINVDILPIRGVDLTCDLLNLRRYVPQEAIEDIFISHTLEHFTRDEVRRLLVDFHAMLCPGGDLWVSVPGLDLWYEAAQTLRSSAAFDGIMGTLIGGGRDRYDMHRCVFTAEYLEMLLRETGFRDVASWTEPPAEFRGLAGGWLARVDGKPISLNYFARK